MACCGLGIHLPVVETCGPPARVVEGVVEVVAVALPLGVVANAVRVPAPSWWWWSGCGGVEKGKNRAGESILTDLREEVRVSV